MQDSGIGITKEQAVAIFHPFVQADITTTRKYGGTGLGLSVAQHFAQGLGGDVWLSESSPDHGSTFTISIKCEPAASGLETSDGKKIDLKGLKVILAEDNSDNRLLLTQLLHIAKADVVGTAENGKEVVSLVAAKDADVILMDLQMPILDGYEAMRLLKEKNFKKPVIALTAHALNEEKERCRQAGFTDHLAKPINLQSLITALEPYIHH